MEDKLWKVYVHTNIANGKRYVGITSRVRPEIRWANGRGYNENPHFKSAIEKYGWDGFSHDVLYDDLDADSAKRIEKELIAMWHTQDREFGYNMTSGGDGTPDYHPSEETRAKLSFVRRKENLSEETKRKRSLSLSNRKLSDSHKRKIGEGNSKPIDMFDKSGNFIRHFDSARSAELELNISHTHISQCCNHKRMSAGGYVWKFAQ